MNAQIQLHRSIRLFCCLGIFSISMHLSAQPGDLPWDPDPDCTSIVTTGKVVVSCGVVTDMPPQAQYTVAVMDMIGALPAAGRIDVSASTDVYHHDSWRVDSIGNIFGLTIDNCANIYVTATSNYSSDFFGYEATIRYGEIGGGVNSTAAAGTVYKLDATTGQATVFAVLPQQAYNFDHYPCEGFTQINRTTGPGLGNIIFDDVNFQFYVTNFEDGRIYRIDTTGTILDSYDPGLYDDGVPGVSDLEDLAYGLDINNDFTELFYGNIGDYFNNTLPGVYSIPINPDGSFVGTVDNSVMPAGASWDNYVGDEQFHYELQPEPSGIGSVAFFSDMEFTTNGDLLIGQRIGCQSSIQSSYNHGGQAILLQDGGAGIYDVLGGIIYTSNGALSDQNAYGGVSEFLNPNGTTEFIFSSADILNEQGPHGILTIEEYNYGNAGNPASPAGVVSYGLNMFNDPKGVGGDVYMFKECACEVECPLEIVTQDIVVCSNEPFDLTYNQQGGSAELDPIWTDENGAIVDPVGLSLQNDNCAPETTTFYLTAFCIQDSEETYLDSLTVTVITDDLLPFIEVIEEPCFIDVLIDADCDEFLELVGDLPTIGPGDAGTVSLDVIQTTDDICTSLNIELSYDCACALNELIVVEEDCEDGTFYINIDFEQENSGDGFTILDQNGEEIGSWTYDELPLQIGPFTGDATTEYSLTIEDNLVIGCEAFANFGPVYCNMSIETQAQDPVCTDGFGSLEITNIVGGLAPYIYSIDGGVTFSTEPLFENLPPDSYEVVVQDATGEEVENIEVIFNPQDIEIALETEVELELGDSYQLNLFTNIPPGDIQSIEWSPATGLSCTDCPNPIATPVVGTVYTVLITDINGCTEEAQVEFRVESTESIYIPNVFTPDDDGTNDLFMIYAKDGTVRQINTFLVFSRWGETVFRGTNFQPNDPAYGWDGMHRGKPMNPAVFAYYAIVEMMDGRIVLYEGDVTLVR
ncbi:MAG: hypothetical protein GYB31_11800 [Bacteroidetes bacterium]|nr:hypothetical protein [Bacteroidota bacterium]